MTNNVINKFSLGPIIYEIPGTYTFVWPDISDGAPVTQVYITIVGAGGGGGQSFNDQSYPYVDTSSSGGGGGAGEFYLRYLYTKGIDTTETLVVGLGGNEQTFTAGTASVFGVLSATGGNNGGNASAGAAGGGGNATYPPGASPPQYSGSAGGHGGDGLGLSVFSTSGDISDYPALGYNGGTAGSSVGFNVISGGGGGGASCLAVGGNGANAGSFPTNGTDGTYGSGGGGGAGCAVGTGIGFGGLGGNGYVKIEFV